LLWVVTNHPKEEGKRSHSFHILSESEKRSIKDLVSKIDHNRGLYKIQFKKEWSEKYQNYYLSSRSIRKKRFDEEEEKVKIINTSLPRAKELGVEIT